jgi:hypothetical protein
LREINKYVTFFPNYTSAKPLQVSSSCMHHG